MFIFAILLQVPKFSRGWKPGQNQNSVRNWVSIGFMSHADLLHLWGFAKLKLALYWMGLPHKHPPASSVSILLNSPQRINHSKVINGYRCLGCRVCFLQIFIKHLDILWHSSLVKSLELWEPSDSRNDGGGWHKAADPALARLTQMMFSGGQKRRAGAGDSREDMSASATAHICICPACQHVDSHRHRGPLFGELRSIFCKKTRDALLLQREGYSCSTLLSLLLR